MGGAVHARFGDIEIFFLVDATAALGEFRALFRGPDDDAWETTRARYPEVADGPLWTPPFGVFVLRGPHMTVLVDAGLGPLPRVFLPETEASLPRRLGDIGLPPADIDAIILTHLHVDHVGWIAPDGSPTFPQARVFAPAKDLAWVRGREPVERDQVLPGIEAVEAAGMLMLHDGSIEVADGINVFPTEGHTPGHTSVSLTSRGDLATILGDVAVHPAQLAHPDRTYRYDVLPELAVATRTVLIPRLLAAKGLVCCPHYPGGTGRLNDEDGTVIWSPLPKPLQQSVLGPF